MTALPKQHTFVQDAHNGFMSPPHILPRSSCGRSGPIMCFQRMFFRCVFHRLFIVLWYLVCLKMFIYTVVSTDFFWVAKKTIAWMKWIKCIKSILCLEENPYAQSSHPPLKTKNFTKKSNLFVATQSQAKNSQISGTLCKRLHQLVIEHMRRSQNRNSIVSETSS